MFFFDFTDCDIASLFFYISKSTWLNVRSQNAYITETFTIFSFAPDNMEENDLNLIEKSACAV